MGTQIHVLVVVETGNCTQVVAETYFHKLVMVAVEIGMGVAAVCIWVLAAEHCCCSEVVAYYMWVVKENEEGIYGKTTGDCSSWVHLHELKRLGRVEEGLS